MGVPEPDIAGMGEASIVARRPRMRRSVGHGWLVPAIPFAWLGLFVLVPMLIVFRLSLSDPVTARPPYLPVWDWGAGLAGARDFLSRLDLETYVTLAGDSLYVSALAGSLRVAFLATALLVLVGYPLALGVARAPRRWRGPLLIALILPFWTSFLIRIYAWIGILKPEGLLNQALMALGLIAEPLAIADSETAVLIGAVYTYLPFMALPIYANLERLDPRLIEAARDLGATRLRAFWSVTWPLSRPGVAAGALICFIPILGEVILPDLLGGPDTLMLGRTLWSEFFGNRDWPLASAVAIVLLALLVGPILIHRRLSVGRDGRG